MIARKGKGSDRKRKVILLFFLILGLSALTCTILLGLYLDPLSSTRRISPPVFEETYSTATFLHEGIRNIDYAIYEALYQDGIRDRDALLVNVQPKHFNGYTWDFIELSVKCDGLPSAQTLRKILTHGLISLAPGIRFTNEDTAERKIVYHIFVRGFYTHRIVLGFDAPQPAAKDVRPKIAIIIDDLGYDSDVAFSLAHLNLPLTFSLLPAAPFTERIARMATKSGCEVMLHLPMEPKSYPSVSPGPGALFLSMDEHEIRQILDQDLRGIPGIRGVNNHMGSAFTEDRDKILVVLKDLKKRNLFYIDSLTTSNSVGLQLAFEIGLPGAGRSVFLDYNPEPKIIRMQMERFLSLARHSGTAIGIAHPHKETLKILEEYSTRIKADFHLVPVSELVSETL